MLKVKAIVALDPDEVINAIDSFVVEEAIEYYDVSLTCSVQPDGVNSYIALLKYNKRE